MVLSCFGDDKVRGCRETETLCTQCAAAGANAKWVGLKIGRQVKERKSDAAARLNGDCRLV